MSAGRLYLTMAPHLYLFIMLAAALIDGGRA